ncbi:hypothetical protein [Staphylococcus simulans]|uniref:hypothetical protein n=1 Tax=Staphylococcus simulans TaxID=1286 RepID=UPI0021D2290A|nr:hypothetical protein [Staphylococcus simulans]UXV43721.1 hypothetical protein MUA12_13375 [Staphylococcus simulans]
MKVTVALMILFGILGLVLILAKVSFLAILSYFAVAIILVNIVRMIESKKDEKRT